MRSSSPTGSPASGPLLTPAALTFRPRPVWHLASRLPLGQHGARQHQDRNRCHLKRSARSASCARLSMLSDSGCRPVRAHIVFRQYQRRSLYRKVAMHKRHLGASSVGSAYSIHPLGIVPVARLAVRSRLPHSFTEADVSVFVAAAAEQVGLLTGCSLSSLHIK